MKKILLCLFAALATVSLSALEVDSVNITAKINPDGSAHITQVWDAEVTSGTEFYIPVENLGKMRITDLQVSENGRQYLSEGNRWNVDRSLAQKAGRCGIVDKGDGVELCWGQGSIGRHIWTAQFDASNLVQGYEDYDGFNFMFVNPGIAPVGSARITIENATGGEEWTSDNVKVWAFGFNGEIYVEDGKIVCYSSGQMDKSHKIIILARFDKGLVQPLVTHDNSFDKLKKKALRKSDYDSEDGFDLLSILLALLPVILGAFGVIWACIIKFTGRTLSKKIYGVNKVTGWWREPPQEGSLPASYYILDKGDILQQHKYNKDLIGAYFLKWVLEKKAVAVKDEKHPKRINLKLEPMSIFSDPCEGELFQMVLEASGDNVILETGEFEKWSRRKYTRFMDWPSKALSDGKAYLIAKDRLDSRGRSTEEGKEKAQQVIQFKNFLKDFTLNNEREVPEVTLWKDYLVFAQLFGIADQVAAQLKKLFPTDFDHYARSLNMDSTYLPLIIHNNSAIANTAYTRAAARMSGVRGAGGGGFSSLGGGGGFSGGGFGGGSR
ncbi:MAG: DUF2207 domain-containing protein [Bacteroidales bacterium]|nr:DUF2207 domain-containing protein [Bacteroidales bacterium]